MEFKIEQKPSYSVLKVKLEKGEEVSAEPGAMVLMKGNIEIKTGMQGGFLKSLMRAALGGESIFINKFIAKGEGEIWFAPSVPGDIHYIKMENTAYVMQDTAYLAHHGEIDIGVAFRGFRGFLTEGELIWLNLKGNGGVWISSFGGIEEIELKKGEKITVDNFHFVAMNADAKYKIKKFGGLKSAILGGEGLVAEIEGPAKILLQTRHLPSLIEKIIPVLQRRLK